MGRGTKRNQGGMVKQVIYSNQVPPAYLPTVEGDTKEQGFQCGLKF